MKKTLSILVALVFVASSNTGLASQIYTVYGGSQNGITIRNASTLAQIDFFDPGFYSSSIVAGNNNNMYLTSGNTIYNYSNTGTYISSFDFPDNGINYHEVAYAGDKIYTAYDGSQNGVTIRDSSSFNQLLFFDPGFAINGITAGNNNDMFLTSGNSIYNYTDTGSFINSFTWPNTSIVYNDTTFNGNKLYTVYDDSQEGITIRNPATLMQLGVVTPGFSPSGIASGDSNDMYLTFENGIYHYADDGTLLNSMVFPDGGIEYDGITYASAVPIPAGIWLFSSGLLLFRIAKQKK
jgi:hypothetical protein